MQILRVYWNNAEANGYVFNVSLKKNVSFSGSGWQKALVPFDKLDTVLKGVKGSLDCTEEVLHLSKTAGGSDKQESRY